MSSSRLPSATLDPGTQSGRKGSRKVRTGCITCKIRKVKCDESKPACQRCVKTGRKCDGYQPILNSAARKVLGTVGAVISSIPDLVQPEEQRAFDHYIRHSAPTLAGTFDLTFWASLVPRLCQSEPAVRHAVLALSSLHKTFDVPTNAHLKSPQFAFQQYSQAITHLRHIPPTGDLAVVPLIVCILFVCIEFFLGADGECQLHICQGRQILAELRDSKSTLFEMIKQDLVPIYTRLSLASFLFGSRPAPIPRYLRTFDDTPPDFTTVQEARASLYSLLDDGLQFSTEARSTATYCAHVAPETVQMLVLRQEKILTEMAQWKVAFSILQARHPNNNKVTGQELLEVYYNSAMIWVSTALSPLETSYDSCLASFAAIVTGSKAVLDAMPRSNSSTFSFETEVAAPLYYTASKCRHPLLRRAAIQLLRSPKLKSRRENLWDPRELIAVSERLLDEEESWGQEGIRPSQANAPAQNSGLEIPPQVPLGEPPSLLFPIYTNVRERLGPDFWASLEAAAIDPPIPSLDSMQGLDIPSLIVGSGSDGRSGSGSMDIPDSSSHASSSPDDWDEPEAETRVIRPIAPESQDVRPPFGLPEHVRVKNAAIGPRSDRGCWLTLFKEPLDGGSRDWFVQREFLEYTPA